MPALFLLDNVNKSLLILVNVRLQDCIKTTMTSTKGKILKIALHLFAQSGFDAVSTSQIADALSITKGALYRHFESKQAIFDAILSKMEQNDKEKSDVNNVPAQSLDKTPNAYQKVSLENVFRFSLEMFRYWTEDDFASSFRKILTIEQYKSEKMRDLYAQYLSSGPVSYVSDIFKSLKIKEPYAEASRFYSVLFMYYSLYDLASNKEDVKQQFERALVTVTLDIKRSLT